MEKIVHIDLFSGIGGFALAVDEVWPENEHIFCDNDKFCQQVLKKHWPNSKIYEDIRDLTNTNIRKGRSRNESKSRKETQQKLSSDNTVIITGGFPCQPFSQAGKRKGKDDDRYLWPEMLRVIKEFRPTWVIGENVAGIVTMAQQDSNSEMACETDNEIKEFDEGEAGGIIWGIIDDLEQSGYSVQTFIIPAVAVNAPHRRDRVWIIAYNANASSKRRSSGSNSRKARQVLYNQERNTEKNKQAGNRRKRGAIKISNVENTIGERSGRRGKNGRQVLESQSSKAKTKGSDSKSGNDTNAKKFGQGRDKKGKRQHRQFSRIWGNQRADWDKNWFEVATKFCRVDDGLPAELDGFKLTKSAHRKERLKSLGNAIVPQVAVEIMKAIKQSEYDEEIKNQKT